MKNKLNKRRKIGRPTKRTPEVEKAFLHGIEMGLSIRECCVIAGISRETYSQWMKKFPEFSDLKRHAEFKPMERALKSITAAMFHDWRAAAWWLERRHPQEYSLRRKITNEDAPLLVEDSPPVNKDE